MKEIIHFMKSNFLYNKIELAISYGVTFIILLIFLFTGHDAIVINLAIYAVIYAFTTNKMKHSLKFYTGLPLSSSKLLLTKMISDIVYFLPAIILSVVGLSFSQYNLAVLPLLISLILVTFLATLFLMDLVVQTPRLENTSASFLNKFVYVRKIINAFFIVSVGSIPLIAVYSLPVEVIYKQLLSIPLLGLIVFLKFKGTLKLIQDESLSYFIPRRDVVSMGWKFGLISLPALFAFYSFYMNNIFIDPNKYGENEIYSYVLNDDVSQLSNHLKNYDSLPRFSPALMDVALYEKKKSVSNYLHQSYEMYPEQLIFNDANLLVNALELGLEDMVVQILKNNSDAESLVVLETGSSLLHLAGQFCQNNLADYIINAHPHFINLQNKDGVTPLFTSILSGCISSTVLLLEAGASLDINYNETNSILELVDQDHSLYFLIKRQQKRLKQDHQRTPAQK